jgi:hypothetical protein
LRAPWLSTGGSGASPGGDGPASASATASASVRIRQNASKQRSKIATSSGRVTSRVRRPT